MPLNLRSVVKVTWLMIMQIIKWIQSKLKHSNFSTAHWCITDNEPNQHPNLPIFHSFNGVRIITITYNNGIHHQFIISITAIKKSIAYLLFISFIHKSNQKKKEKKMNKIFLINMRELKSTPAFKIEIEQIFEYFFNSSLHLDQYHD